MIIANLRLQYIYNMVDVGNGAIPSANFMDETTKGLHGFGVLMLLNYLGIWLINMEYIVAFIIACLVSFRSLFAQREDNALKETEEQARRRRAAIGYTSRAKGFRAKARLLHETLLDTLKTWEESTRVDNELITLPRPPDGRLSVDVQEVDTWSDVSKSAHGRSDSVRTLAPQYTNEP
ncbi:hypothetical protein DL770_009444 [Monosporascus sp. CRB-9-2]|nr:hypothetical protein DL770_009444 [Monosporascus sp. CRB-9-2]